MMRPLTGFGILALNLNLDFAVVRKKPRGGEGGYLLPILPIFCSAWNLLS